MGLEFVIGGCGSGKSRSLYERAIAEGGKYVFLVPDQSTSQVQQELLRLHPRHVISGIDVAGFTQYAYRTFERTGLEAPTVLDDVGKKMILRRVIESVRGDLKVYQSQVGVNGFTEKMKSFLSECRQYKITSERLSEVGRKEQTSGLLSAKLSDVSRIMEAFDRALGDTYTTAEELMQLLSGQIGRDPSVKDTVFVLDGFTGFTPIQYDVIRELLHYSRNVIVVLTALSSADLTGRNAEKGLFSLSSVTYRKLTDLADKEGVIAKENYLGNPRWGCHPALTYAAERFGTGRGSLDRADRKERDRLLQEAISLKTYSDLRSEVRACARAIRRDVVGDGLRYQDIAVTLTDPEKYAPILEEIFPEYQIPYFIDRKRDLSGNPLIAYIEATFRTIEEDFSYSGVFACIRTGFTPLTPEEADLLENYVLATGKRGFSSWNKKWAVRSKRDTRTPEEMETVNASRARFVKQIRPLRTVVLSKTATVRERLKALYEYLIASGVPDRLEQMKGLLNGFGMQEFEREYEQVYRKVIDVISLYEQLMGDEVLSAEAFADILQEGLKEQKIGLVPPSLDRLVVGDLTRTRYSGVRRLYVLGMSEELIPSVGGESGVLSRYERSSLKDELEMAPGVGEKIRQQEYYCYLLFSKPSEHLTVSCSIGTGEDGGKHSPYMTRLIRLSEAFRLQNKKAEEESRGWEAIGAPDADRSLLVQARLEEWTPWFLALYDSYRSMPSYDRFLSLMEQGVSYGYRPEALRPETAQALCPENAQLSVSRLETFAGCAFAYFLRYTLGLSEREMYRFRPVDFGNLCHDILDSVFREMKKEGLSWRDLSDQGTDQERAERAERRRKLIDSCMEDPEFLSSYQSADEERAVTEVLLQKSRAMIELCMEVISYQLSFGSFEQMGSEIGFGNGFSEEKPFPPLKIRLPEGGNIFLQGKIDRLDVSESENGIYYQVVDYKTGHRKFDYSRFLSGTQLQLIVYLMAAGEYLRAETGQKPIEGGMYYFYLNETQVGFDSKYKYRREEWSRDVISKAMAAMRMNGCLVNDPDYLSRLSAEPEDRNNVVEGLKNLKPGNHVFLEPEGLGQMEEKAKEIVTDLVSSIRKGRIAIEPFTDADGGSCKYCPMKRVCKFDPNAPGFSGRKRKKG